MGSASRTRLYRGGTGTGRVEAPPVAADAADAPLGEEGAERIAHELVAHAEGGAQGAGRHGRVGLGEGGEEPGGERVGLGGVLVVDGDEARDGGRLVDDEAQVNGRRAGGGAVLDAQLDGAVVGEFSEVEVGVPERMWRAAICGAGRAHGPRTRGML